MARRESITMMITAIVVVAAAMTVGRVTGACPAACSCDPATGLYDCRDANLRGIPTRLPNPGSVKQLLLSGNKIEVVASLDMYRNLVHLDLANNRLEVIEAGAFAGAADLRMLSLANNRISVVDRRMFRGLKSLEIVDLSNNDIAEISDEAFADCAGLLNLDASGNAIKRVARAAFVGLDSSLSYLDLSRNRLTEIPTKSFAELRMLRALLLENNAVQVVRSNSFDGLAKLRKLSLTGNAIVTISDGAFAGAKAPVDLRYLSLKENKLARVPTTALASVPALEELDLSGNAFEVVDPDSFKPFDRLRLLRANDCPRLKVVRNYAFSELILLEELQLGGNRALDTLEPHALLATPSLKRLFLARNKLSSVPEELADWRRLDVLDLRYNPWRCECASRWMADMLKYVARNATRFYADEVYCVDVGGQHRRIVDALPRDFGCPLSAAQRNDDAAAAAKDEFDHRIMFGIIGATSLALVVAFFVILYKFKIDVFKRCRGQMRYRRQSNLETVVTMTSAAAAATAADSEQTPMKVQNGISSSGEITS
ncbi:uncharacterized protein LOC141910919 [Tubulanus polymorphus]|uniref:uncharacterized protein LOC141910919 n=1 Tax=Tubulanus polymorphus TaxID=672921 RepID=UPI003DA6B4B2